MGSIRKGAIVGDSDFVKLSSMAVREEINFDTVSEALIPSMGSNNSHLSWSPSSSLA